MGQTLSHGVYLPNEGERNCYAGLASNWQILNTAVGAIAEKAPLVHTHTVSQITDFPAYGTTAGTICEGNDSRLSDARTPVAHTHTKSDVTDLFNSNFIPSANNSYDLGSSSYQWNNLYAKKVNTQSVNGINPGALSLTNLDSDGYIDLSDHISANSEYLYTPAYDGWLALYCQTTGFHAENAVGIFNREDATSYRWSNSVTSSINLLRYGTYHGSIILPVRAGIQYGCWVVVNSSTPLATSTLFFYKAKGNV